MDREFTAELKVGNNEREGEEKEERTRATRDEARGGQKGLGCWRGNPGMEGMRENAKRRESKSYSCTEEEDGCHE